MVNFRKQVAFFGAVLLFLQAAPVSLPHVYAETEASVDAQMIDAFRSHMPDYLRNRPVEAFEQVADEEVQEFSFVTKTFQTTVGQPVILRFTSKLAADEVVVRIPENGQILEAQFSNGETIHHSHGEYWVLKTTNTQRDFELPVLFEQAGNYFLTVDDDADHFYLEVGEGVNDTQTPVHEVLEESGLSEETKEQSEMGIGVEETQQENQETEVDNDFQDAVQPVMATEKGLSISEELIAEEHARILEEITDPLNRNLVTVSNWSQFRSAWNNSRTTFIGSTAAINFSSSILGDSLNTRSDSVQIAGQSPLNLGTSNNSLMINNATLTIQSDIITENSSSTAPIVGITANSTSANINLAAGTILNMRNSPCISILGTSSNSAIRFTGASQDEVRIHNTRAISPIQLNNGFIDFRNSRNTIYIGSQETSSNWIPPITSNNSGTTSIAIANNNVMMGGRYSLSRWDNFNLTPLTTFSESWNLVSANIAGVNGTVINSSSSNPGDFSEKYLQNVTSINYRSLLLNAQVKDGFDPPISRYNLTLSASPQEAGSPQADSTTIAANSTTTLKANPNEGYRFVKWEVVSGTNASVASETSETTTFTMGSSDAVVRAVYEKISYSLSFQASPAEGGAPSADEDTLIEQEETEIHANPNEGYRFEKWEILSGTDASIEDKLAETTTFTMGSSDAVVRAVYEEEATDVRPVDPLDPEEEVAPENPPVLPEDQGLFSIDFVSSFDFGSQAISAHDQTYYAQPQRLLNEDGTVNETEERPNYVQVSDRRPSEARDGWELSVHQKEQFETEAGEELRGARLILQNQQVVTAQDGIAPGLQHANPMTLVPGGAKRTLLKAQGPEGTGTWIYRFGNAETAGQSVALEVPKGAAPSATSYSTTLTWELSSVPAN